MEKAINNVLQFHSSEMKDALATQGWNSHSYFSSPCYSLGKLKNLANIFKNKYVNISIAYKEMKESEHLKSH
jgi:hypothetical protein